MLVDTYGRVATDLRVSLTDRCNLRCTYCMPAEGLDWLPGAEVLTDDEIVRLVGIAVDPRRHRGRASPAASRCPARARRASWPRSPRLRPRPRLSLTTNGIGLAGSPARSAAGRARPGQRLARHPRPGRFAQLTRRDRLADVLDGLAAAAAAGLRPVKVNAVLHARRQRRRGAGAAALVPRPRLRAALHRADAA